MALVLEQKKEVVNKLMQTVAESKSVIAADYKGIKSSDMTELRHKCRELAGVKLHVVKNTLAKRAFIGTDYEQLTDHLHGPVVMAFSQDEPSSTARLLKDFAKEKDKLPVIVSLIEGKLLAGNQLDLIASLPTKQEALTQLVTVMQAPISKFVRTLAAPTTKLVRTVAAIGDAKK
jgi:large subunit ribosomal protein L10